MAFEKVASLSDLEEDEPVRAEVGGIPVVVVRTGETVHAILDVCSHEDYPLHEGLVWGNRIECALHGSMFDLQNGAPTSLPATSPVPVYAVKLEGEDVHVDVDQQLNDAPIPDHF